MRHSLSSLSGLIAAAALEAALLSAGCGRGGTCVSVEGDVWHTAYHVKYVGAESLRDSLAGVFEEVDAALSVFNAGSEISRVNRNDTSVRAGRMMREVFGDALRVSGKSGGAFDPTVGPLVDLWGFGRRGTARALVSQSAVDSVLPAVGMRECRIDREGRVIKKSLSTEFDFSAIAKGYACDEAARMLERNGVTSYLIEIGGEIVGAGLNPEGRPWRVMVENPLSPPDSVGASGLGVVEVRDKALATSGRSRRQRKADGRTLSHIINPLTGYPEVSSVLSATVLAPRCMTADAFATACMAMHPDSALAMLEREPEVEGLIVLADSTGSSLRVLTTSGFRLLAG